MLCWSPELALIASGVIAAVAVVTIGLFRPSVALRYLLPDLGAIALLLPVLLRAVRSVAPTTTLVAIAFIVVSAVPQVIQRLRAPLGGFAYSFNFEQPTAWILSQGGARRVVFLWDNPSALLAKPFRLAEVGGFFFRRAGHTVEVLIPRYPRGADPYPAVLDLAAGRTDAALIWSADRSVPQTSTLHHPVGALRDPARWTCHNFGNGGTLYVLACVPKGGVRR